MTEEDVKRILNELLQTKKISELPVATELEDTDIIPIVQNGVNKNMQIKQLKASYVTLYRTTDAEIVTASNIGMQAVESIGENLTYSIGPGTITIGDNISYVNIEASIQYNYSTIAGTAGISIYKNGVLYDRRFRSNINGYADMNIQTGLVPVVKGDIISLRASVENLTAGNLRAFTARSIHLTVKQVIK